MVGEARGAYQSFVETLQGFHTPVGLGRIGGRSLQGVVQGVKSRKYRLPRLTLMFRVQVDGWIRNRGRSESGVETREEALLEHLTPFLEVDLVLLIKVEFVEVENVIEVVLEGVVVVWIVHRAVGRDDTFELSATGNNGVHQDWFPQSLKEGNTISHVDSF